MAGSKIATAYVQVMPSMEGVAPKVKSFFGSAGKSSGSAFGANLGGMIKNALVSAGIGTALKETILEGADLQQSLGGIDTLFKDSAETVKASAANAYKTAGLSGNEYMESVTSFSAALIKSLGNDTAKAAEVADTALTDMSDNANKLGSSMESIQNAYQGFAKQNYTMLDNLKLGYGGTKAEMERLIADANKLKEANGEMADLSIDSFSDIVEAIHMIQEEMGIMGATADEASSTLTGSFKAMKAAFSNVLGNLTLGADIRPSLNALAETTKTFLVDNLVPAVTNIITALPGACTTFLDALIPENVNEVVSNAIMNFTTYVREGLPAFFENGAQTIRELISGFLSGLPNLLSSAAEIMKSLLDAILTALPTIWESGFSIISELVLGLISNIPEIISAGASLIGSLLSELASHLPEMLSQGMDLILELIAGIILEIPNLLEEIKALAEDIVEKIKSTDWEKLGSDVVDLIKSGIAAAWDKLASWFTGIWNSLFGNLNVNVNVGGSGGGDTSAGYTPHAKGLDYVPYDGYLAELHKGEMVLTSKQADAVRGGNLPGRRVTVIQNIYSQAKTSADLMREARYQQELAVMMNV